MANPAPTINQINAFNATQGTTIDFNIIGGTELVRSNRIYIYDLSDNSLICTHLYVSTESIHELPPNTDGSIVYESGKSSADFVNGAQYYAQIQTFTDIGGTEGGSGLSVAKMFWCLDDPTLTIDIIPSTISTTSYNVSATYNANTSVVSNIIQQYQFNLYSATGSLLQSSGVIVGNGEQQGTSTAYDISYNFTGLSVGSSYYVVVDVTTTQGMSVSTQSNTFTVSIDTPTLGEATVVNNACDGYISVTSNLSSEYGGSGSGDIVSFETDSENVFTKLQVTLSPTQSGSGTPSPSNVRPIYGVGGVGVEVVGKNLFDENKVNYLANFAQDGGVFTNTATDTRSNVVLVAQAYNSSGTWLANSTSAYAYEAGRYSVVLNAPSGIARLTIKHSGSTKDFILRIPFEEVGTFTISVDITSANPTVIGGVVYKNIQVESGSTATSYEPYVDPLEISEDFNVSLTPTSTDTDPYLFKAVGDIYGDRLEEELVGGSVVWNQLSNIRPATNTTNGITFTKNNDGSVTVNGTATADAVYDMTTNLNSNGKYLMAGCPSGGSLSTYYLGNASFQDTGNGYMMSVTNAPAGTGFRIYVKNGTTVSNKKFYPIICNLTAFFGNATIADAIYAMEQATAGSGVAFMRKYFSKLFTAEYDTGTLKSVNPTAHKMVGVNAWDEEWEVGRYINGVKDTVNNQIRCKNRIRVTPNTKYYFYNGSGESTINFLDADGNFISTAYRNNAEFTTPTNCCYLVFAMNSTYGTTYKNDICINISDPTINGKYFPYEEHTYPLASTTLRGKFELVNGELKANGDIYPSSGQCSRKYIEVDLGAYDWELSSNGYFTATISGVKLPEDVYHAPSMVCKYPTVKAYDLVYNTDGKYDKTASISASTGKTLIRDSSYNSASAFKTAMNGVMLVAEKATTTTETLTPFTQIQEVSKYGTLEYITSNDIPVGHNTTYMTRDVFGGTLDLVSGLLTVDKRYKYFDGSENWLASSNANRYYVDYNPTTFPYKWATDTKAQSNKYDYYGVASASTYLPDGKFMLWRASGTNPTSQTREIIVHDSTVGSLANFKASLASEPLQVVYELNEPLTYQLTPQQIQTLVGNNNVWSEQGDIELSYHIPITNLLVKRQDVDDVSGNWLTLYSQPITQASDMDFTFIDFLNQYGKTYKYALVPLLTQTQSGVEVEVEGGYTVSDEVQSIFDGVFIADSTGLQKCKANVGYGNVDMNQTVGTITPIGAKYPVVITNSKNQYHNGSISGTIVPDDYYYNGNLSRIDMVNKRNELEQFLTNKRAKIIKDWNSNIWLVMIMDNIDCSFDNNYGMGIVTFNANWLEVGDPTNQQDLYNAGLINVGGV